MLLQGTTLLLPTGSEGSSSMIAQALSIFKTLSRKMSFAGAHSANLPSISGNDAKTDDLSRLKKLEIPVSDAVSATSDHISDPDVEVFSLRSPQK